MLKNLILCRILRVVLPFVIAILAYIQGRYNMNTIVEVVVFFSTMILLMWNTRLAVEEFLLEVDDE